MTKSILQWMVLAAGLGMFCAQHASAQDFKARSWAASCASCHGTNGRSEGEVPPLAGKSKADLLASLQEFKAGKRKTATIMHQHAKGYSDAQLERIAEYFSQQPR
jgi:sulfide dehydrogenase cytochrome subunit